MSLYIFNLFNADMQYANKKCKKRILSVPAVRGLTDMFIFTNRHMSPVNVKQIVYPVLKCIY